MKHSNISLGWICKWLTILIMYYITFEYVQHIPFNNILWNNYYFRLFWQNYWGEEGHGPTRPPGIMALCLQSTTSTSRTEGVAQNPPSAAWGSIPMCACVCVCVGGVTAIGKVIVRAQTEGGKLGKEVE